MPDGSFSGRGTNVERNTRFQTRIHLTPGISGRDTCVKSEYNSD